MFRKSASDRVGQRDPALPSSRPSEQGSTIDSALRPAVFERIVRSGVVAVLVIDELDDAVPTARALLAGGIDVMELTLRTPVAMEALRQIRAEVPEMLPGVGTVLQPQQVAEIKAAGAAFGVSPGTNPRVIAAALEHDLPFVPGVATPSDIEAALELGCQRLKFFPAEPSGGLAYLRNMAAPYAHLGLQFVPLGGLSEKNLKDYMDEPLVMAVGGSWVATRQMIQEAAWAKITANAAAARGIVNEARASQRVTTPHLRGGK